MFMSGFCVSASQLGMPDAGLMSYGEVVEAGGRICAATRLPVIGDGDTGYGNAVNAKRTARARPLRRWARVHCGGTVATRRRGARRLRRCAASHRRDSREC